MNKILIIIIALALLVGAYFISTKNNPVPEKSETTTADDSSSESQPDMTFFITSDNPGTGANFGGLAGADAYCQALADTAGGSDKTWRAYLSVAESESNPAVDARDRIGNGPWHNYNGELIASSITDLHSENNAITKETGLTENGNAVNGRGDTPNVHDILTGTNADGTLALAEDGTALTCDNWTSGTDGSAMVGHHDRLGPDTLETATSWNAAHGSRGCSLPDLNGTGGGGLLYCFAL